MVLDSHCDGRVLIVPLFVVPSLYLTFAFGLLYHHHPVDHQIHSPCALYLLVCLPSSDFTPCLHRTRADLSRVLVPLVAAAESPSHIPGFLIWSSLETTLLSLSLAPLSLQWLT